MSKYRRLDVEGRGEKGEERAGDEPSRLGQRRGGVWGACGQLQGWGRAWCERALGYVGEGLVLLAFGLGAEPYWRLQRRRPRLGPL